MDVSWRHVLFVLCHKHDSCCRVSLLAGLQQRRHRSVKGVSCMQHDVLLSCGGRFTLPGQSSCQEPETEDRRSPDPRCVQGFFFYSWNLQHLTSFFCSFKCHYFSLTVTVAAQTPAAAQQKKKPGDDSSSTLSTGSNNNNNNNNPDRFCSICQASFNNPLMAQQHYMGKKHRKQMTKLKLMETYGPSTTPGQTPQPGTHEPARPSQRTPLSK